MSEYQLNPTCDCGNCRHLARVDARLDALERRSLVTTDSGYRAGFRCGWEAAIDAAKEEAVGREAFGAAREIYKLRDQCP